MSTLDAFPVADPWFVREQMDDGVTLVTEPAVHPFLRCNVWHVRGRDADLVVDTAMDIRPLRPFVERKPDGELLAVATHAHPDHVGGLHEFEQRAIHPAEADVVARPGLASVETAHYDGTTIGPYESAGYEFDELLIDHRPEGGMDATVYEIRAAKATRLIDDGDVIDLGDRQFEVLHLPGHSPGSIGLWEPASGVLFSGDALYDGPLLDELDGSNVDDYLTTIARLRELPVSVVHGGHERSFGRDRLIELCDEYLGRRSHTDGR